MNSKIHSRIMTSTQGALEPTANQETDLGTSDSTNHHKEIILSTHHTILDQITEITVTPVARTTKIDKVSTETTLEVRDTNKHRDTIRETNTTSTDMTITKIETGLITEEDQTNTNTIGINIKHRSFSNSQTKT